MSNEDNKRNDIFNPEYKQKQNFFRKSNLYKFLILGIIFLIFIWGSRDFIYGSITPIEVRNLKMNIVNPILNSDGESTYIIINKATYNVKLIIECSAIKFKSNYNNTILSPNQLIVISFTGITNTECEIKIKGVKV